MTIWFYLIIQKIKEPIVIIDNFTIAMIFAGFYELITEAYIIERLLLG
ncbi:hypothetical protein E0157_065 [Escherichia phage SP15]|uniref:Uncharacterized protein n=1 Tax=Escherichia phage SP15 TaxID=2184265 RepID=A0A494WI48_9CAUD|nr:hypothetical protein HWA82_gp157 [Escherichia phage SP15]BBJ33839.1 hypothetical protein E0157_065 [Escherichia phage SP15]